MGVGALAVLGIVEGSVGVLLWMWAWRAHTRNTTCVCNITLAYRYRATPWLCLIGLACILTASACITLGTAQCMHVCVSC